MTKRGSAMEVVPSRLTDKLWLPGFLLTDSFHLTDKRVVGRIPPALLTNRGLARCQRVVWRGAACWKWIPPA